MISWLISFFTADRPSGSAYLYLLAAVLLTGSGWYGRGVVADRDAASAALSAQQVLDAQSAQSEALLATAKRDYDNLAQSLRAARDKAQADGDAATARLAVVERQAQETTTKLQKDISDAKARAIAAGRQSCSLSNDWVRLYDAPLRALSAALSTAGRAADSPAGAAAARQLASGRDEWDVVQLNAENARRWQSCRSQLNALIDLAQPAGTGQ